LFALVSRASQNKKYFYLMRHAILIYKTISTVRAPKEIQEVSKLQEILQIAFDEKVW
jgi:hypothetical protein